MWKVNRDNIGDNLVNMLYDLQDRLRIAASYDDVPEWIASKELLNKYKVEKIVVQNKIDKINRTLREESI